MVNDNSPAGPKAPTVATETDAEGHPFDRAAALEHLDGDGELLKELAELFLAGFPDMLSRARQAVADLDGQELAREAHTIKGCVANFVATRAFNAAVEVEMSAREGDLAAAQKGCTQLAIEVSRLASALTELTGQAQPTPA